MKFVLTEMDHETALDLSLPKLERSNSPEHNSNSPEHNSKSLGHTSSGNSPTGYDINGSSSMYTSIQNEQVNGNSFSEDPDVTRSSNSYTKTEDYMLTSKKRKYSPDILEDNNPATAYLARSGEGNDAYLSDDMEQYPAPFLDVNSQDVGLIKQVCRGVSVCLHDEKLWKAFANFGTEMIINRGGRRMFPHIILSIDGLNPQIVYSVLLEIVPADQRRYKFINNQWMPMGMADPGPGVQPITHPDSPNVGSFWMRNRASFSKVRLTNNKESSVKKCSDGNILLLSMHKYKVVIKIREEGTPVQSEMSFEFDESAFVAVTAYQNSQITQLKIQNNPFAKAFRDSHNPSFSQKSVSPRKRDLKTNDGPVGSTVSPSTFAPSKEFQKPEAWPFPYPPFPFQQSGVNMAAFDQLCRNTAGRNALYPAPYFPWATMGPHWSYPLWMKDTQGLVNSLSKTLVSMTPEVGSMRLPVDMKISSDYTDNESQK